MSAFLDYRTLSVMQVALGIKSPSNRQKAQFRKKLGFFVLA